MSVFQAGDGIFLKLERSRWFQQTLKSRSCEFDNGFDMGLWGEGAGEFSITDNSWVHFFKNRVDGNDIMENGKIG